MAGQPLYFLTVGNLINQDQTLLTTVVSLSTRSMPITMWISEPFCGFAAAHQRRQVALAPRHSASRPRTSPRKNPGNASRVSSTNLA